MTDLSAVIQRIVGSGCFKHRQLHLCGFSDGGQVRGSALCALFSAPQLFIMRRCAVHAHRLPCLGRHIIYMPLCGGTGALTIAKGP